MGLTETIDITGEQRGTILALLERHLPGTEAWAYGSRVKWTSRPQSDLDLVVFATPEQQRQVNALKEAFQESDLPFRVDLFVWDEVPETFRGRIEAERVTLADAAEGAGRKDWRNMHWGDLVTLEYGRSLRGYDTEEGAFRVFGTNGPIGWHDEALSKGASVVVGRKGAYRGVHYSPSPCFVIDTAFYLKTKVEIDVRWAYYTLLTQDINGLDSGSAIPSTSRKDFYALPVSVPPRTEQRAIANILGKLDDKIELNRRMNATLEGMARALFRSWFVDFDPVRAKMEGRDTGMPKEVADLFPDRLVESELGEIPEGWDVSEIGTEADAVGGGTPSTKEPAYWNGGQHCWATPKDLSKLLSPVLLDTDRKITDAGVRRISSGLLPRGTVLLSSRAPIGYLAITEVPTAVNQGFIAIICRKRLPALYVLSWCHENLEHIKDISGGSTFAEISKKTFRPLPVVVPPERVLGLYDEASRSLHDRVVSNTRESVLLASLRDALLPKLVSGELPIGMHSGHLKNNTVERASS